MSMTDKRALWELVEKWRQASYVNLSCLSAESIGCAAIGKCADELAAILERPVEVGGWLPIESAPRDGTMHVRGLHVFSSTNGRFLYWDAVVGHVDDEDGLFYDQCGDVCGWAADDFSHWIPLPASPELNESMVRGKS